MSKLALSCSILFVFLILIHDYIGSVEGGNRTDAKNLHDHVLTGYRKAIMPFYDQTINVTVEMFLFSINDFDEISGTFSTVAAFLLHWEDPRVKWNPEEFGNLTVLAVPASYIWYPNLYFLNPAKKMEAI